MNKPFLQIGAEHFSFPAKEIKPLEGYEKPINKESKNEFPNCCERHSKIYEATKNHYNQFPNCCEHHKNLLKEKGFNKAHYSYVVNKVVNQIAYTEHCIKKYHNADDWFDAITDYFDINISSFGQFKAGFGSPLGLNLYIDNVILFIKESQLNLSKNKKEALINYFNFNESVKSSSNTDLNVLYATYQKWLKIFPFELSIFSHLKEHFEKQLPFIKGKAKVNRYSKIASFNIHTKESLIELLISLTNNIITQINTVSLYDKGLLTEPEKLQLELIVSERKNKLQKGYVNNSKYEDQRYRNILKEWYKDEVEFIKNIIPLLPNDVEELNSKTTKIIEQLNKYKFSSFLIEKNYKPIDIYQLIQKHSGKELMPYTIALLSEIKYLDYFFNEFAKNKTDGYKILANIYEQTERRIKGNINILNDGSKEDVTQYTSYTYMENIRKTLKGL